MTASAVLFSGGLDSAVLLADEATRFDPVWPIHVRAGLSWEHHEADVIRRLLQSPPLAGRTKPLTTLTADLRDVYPANHWAFTGRPPAFDTPDEDVYLVGRNVILIAKAAMLCARLDVNRLALGPLAGNPFPDATPAFFRKMEEAMSAGLDRRLDIATPLANRRKEDVIRLGLRLGVPLGETLSCMNPEDGPQHCGACSKCRERRDAFRVADVPDDARYAVMPSR